MAELVSPLSARNLRGLQPVIFVTVGNARNPFRRLVEAADQAAARLPEKVVIQSGHTPYQALHAEQIPFVDLAQFEKLMSAARIVVSHGGSGTILMAVRMGKPTIVMPRRKHLGEHVNDHQLEITAELARTGRLCAVENAEELWAAIVHPPAARSGAGVETPALLQIFERWMELWTTSGRIPARSDLRGVLPPLRAGEARR